MSESTKFVLMSRRGAFLLLGSAVAAGVVVPATMLITTDADAQTRGMERRDDRRDDRLERRTERRSKKKKKKETTGSATEKN